MLAVQSLARDSDGLGEVILSRNTDSQSFAELRVIDNSLAQEFGQAITGTDPVKLGPVSFTPRELFEMLRRAFEQPPALTLTGSLSRPPSDGAAGASDGRVSLCVVGVVRGSGPLERIRRSPTSPSGLPTLPVGTPLSRDLLLATASCERSPPTSSFTRPGGASHSTGRASAIITKRCTSTGPKTPSHPLRPESRRSRQATPRTPRGSG